MFVQGMRRLCVLNRCKLNQGIQSYRLYSQTYYEILGVRRDASQKEIQQAFLEKSKQLHPDKKIHDGEQHDRFVRLNEAYTCLSKAERKEEYDARLPRFQNNTDVHVRLSAKAGRKGLFRVAKSTYYKICISASLSGILFGIFYLVTLDLYQDREQEVLLIFKSPEALDDGEEAVEEIV